MKITVMLGGASAERDVSIASGMRVLDALRSRGHAVRAVDPSSGTVDDCTEQAYRERGVKRAPPSLDELRRLSAAAFSPMLVTLPEVRDADVVFLCLHGGFGEDGTVQGLLDFAGVRYTGSGMLASAIAMDKDISKTLFRASGVQTADWRMTPVSRDDAGAALGFPLVVKPSKQGSTVGLTLVKDPARYDEAVREALRHDDEVIVEAFIPGRELTVAVLGDRALPVGEIILTHELYDYESKYTKGLASEVFPAALTAAQTAEVQRLALFAHRGLKLSGCSRIDFRMTSDSEFYCLEANTAPGMTTLSLVPQAAEAAGLSFEDLCEEIVREAVEKDNG